MNSKFQSAPATPTKSLEKIGSSISNLRDSKDSTPKVIERNVITKYAFATRVGFIPNNPSK